MFYIFKRLLNKNTAVFPVLEPKIELTVSVSQCIKELNTADVKYNQVCKGYIVFPAKLFNGLVMMVGLHYKGSVIEYIEVFRPQEYYDSPDFDIKKSFDEIHNSVMTCYGKPKVTNPPHLTGFPYERWTGKNFSLEHYIIDRFGPEEHLHFKFVHP